MPTALLEKLRELIEQGDAEAETVLEEILAVGAATPVWRQVARAVEDFEFEQALEALRQL